MEKEQKRKWSFCEAASRRQLSKLQLKIAVSSGWSGSLWMVNVGWYLLVFFNMQFFFIADLGAIYALSSHIIKAKMVTMFICFYLQCAGYLLNGNWYNNSSWLLTKLLPHLRFCTWKEMEVRNFLISYWEEICGMRVLPVLQLVWGAWWGAGIVLNCIYFSLPKYILIGNKLN